MTAEYNPDALMTVKTGRQKYEWANQVSLEMRCDKENYRSVFHHCTRLACRYVNSYGFCTVTKHTNPNCINSVGNWQKRDFVAEVSNFLKTNPSAPRAIG